MTLPPAPEVRKLSGRALLALGVEWFETEGRLAISSIEAVEREFGASAVGAELHVRAAMAFAMATFIGAVRAKAMAADARKIDGEFASALAPIIRSGFLPQPPEAPKNAA